MLSETGPSETGLDETGLDEIAKAHAILAVIEDRHRRELGDDTYRVFKSALRAIADGRRER
ncbi:MULTISPECIES: hypothetical protein [Amycolatopsis]|uniref:Uncharacterized protein n=1 Tax=Amycolatopsis tucumanensis TaxID=401106 RepID=A0ABP7JAE7_9PSEU|nr:hypothetical protein [Amycolatopsis tucumanensis]MCF6421712.1 hypothetical protein [Amycolatopsis tucumanensis]